MIRITKGQEPAEWTQVRNTPGMIYEDAPKDVLREALLNEQGGLCAYCMRRINFTPGQTTTTRIEHLKPRKLSLEQGHPEETLAYSNMILCCDGNCDKSGNFHCDRSKEDKSISFRPFDQVVIDSISYSSKNGTIKSSIQQYNKEFNEVLNLNHPRLEKNRLAVIRGLVHEMGKKKWSRKDLTDRLEHYSKKVNGEFKEYCGVAIWFLNKKLKHS